MPQEKMEGGAYCRITPQIRELTRQWDKNAHIDRQLYEKYDVKRGLRDATGRGVRWLPTWIFTADCCTGCWACSRSCSPRCSPSPAWPGGALTAWRSWARGEDHPPRHQVRGKAPGLCVYGRKIGGSGVPARFPPEPGGEICRIF